MYILCIPFFYSTKVNDSGVAGGDVETSVYYVKDALDANITYSAGPQVHPVGEKGEEGKGYDDGVDIGGENYLITS